MNCAPSLLMPFRLPGATSAPASASSNSRSRCTGYLIRRETTSIAAGLGFAAARDLAQQKHKIVCVIGDGAMSAGMAYEAMNNAGALGARLIVILNDNDMSIAPPVGAMSGYLARLVSSQTYHGVRYFLKRVMRRFPRLLRVAARRAEEYARGFWMGGTLFEELGFFYVGPIDGHNLDQ